MVKRISKLLAASLCGAIIATGCGNATQSNEPQREAELTTGAEVEVEESTNSQRSANLAKSNKIETFDYSGFVSPEIRDATGIIRLTLEMDPNNQCFEFYVMSFDPVTGESAEYISAPVFPESIAIGTYDARFAQFDQMQKYDNSKELMSPDCTRLALSINASGDWERSHAGWLDLVTGEVVDVVYELGLDDATTYCARGFEENGDFVFSVIEDGQTTTRGVAVNDVFNSGNVYELDAEKLGWYHESPSGDSEVITDIGDGFYVVSRRTSSDGHNFAGELNSLVVYEDGTEVDYAPDNTRQDWSGILSPDQTQVAFISVSKNSDDISQIYVTSVDGGEEPHLVTDYNYGNDDEDRTITSLINSSGVYYPYNILVGWK